MRSHGSLTARRRSLQQSILSRTRLSNIRATFSRREAQDQNTIKPEHDRINPHVEQFLDLDPSTQPSFNQDQSTISFPSTLSSLHNSTPPSTISTLISLLQSPHVQISPYERFVLDIVLQAATTDLEKSKNLEEDNKRLSDERDWLREQIKLLKASLDKEGNKRKAFEMLWEKKKSELIIARGIIKAIEHVIMGVGIEGRRVHE